MGRRTKVAERAAKAGIARWEATSRERKKQEIKANIEKLRRRKGQCITKEEARAVVVCYSSLLLKYHLDHKVAIRKTAENLQFSRKSVRSAVASWKKYGEIRVAQRYGPTGGRLTASVKRHLVRCVEQLNLTGKATLAQLQAMLRTPWSANGNAGGDAGGGGSGGPGGGASGGAAGAAGVDNPEEPGGEAGAAGGGGASGSAGGGAAGAAGGDNPEEPGGEAGAAGSGGASGSAGGDVPVETHEPITVSISTIRNWLKILGYSHGKTQKGFVVTDTRKARIREYLIDIHKARQKEKAGTHIIVFTDESYINTGHVDGTSWFPIGENTSEHACHRGRRLIIVHAITKDGPLVFWEGEQWENDPKKEGWFKQVARERGEGSQSPGAAAAAAGAKAAAEAWAKAGSDLPPTSRTRSVEVRRAVFEASKAAATAAGQQAAAAAAAAAAASGPAAAAATHSAGVAPQAGAGGAGPSTGGGGGGGGGGASSAPPRKSGRRTKPSVKKQENLDAQAISKGSSPDVADAGEVKVQGKAKEKGKGKAKEGNRAGEVPNPGAGAGGGNPRTRFAHAMEEEATAELIYPAGEKSAGDDYHKNMDADVFMKWIERRLVPAFKKMYWDDGVDGKPPNRPKMILVMDNAAYHHGMEVGWTPPLNASKKVNLERLRDLVTKKGDEVLDHVDVEGRTGVRGINISRSGETRGFEMPAEGKEFAKFPAGPSLQELQHATHRILQAKDPQSLLSRAAQYFDKNDLGELLFTPPYCPALQPIELFWAFGKNYVAANFIAKRKLEDVYDMLREGLYGLGKQGTNDAVANMVRHSYDQVNKYIKRDEVLRGTVDQLDNIPSDYRVSKITSVCAEEEGDADDDINEWLEGEEGEDALDEAASSNVESSGESEGEGEGDVKVELGCHAGGTADDGTNSIQIQQHEMDELGEAASRTVEDDVQGEGGSTTGGAKRARGAQPEAGITGRGGEGSTGGASGGAKRARRPPKRANV